MKWLLTIISCGVLVSMLSITTLASMDRSITVAWDELSSDRWFQATLIDAYCGFLLFYLWVAYKEVHWAARLGWFFGIALLGNIAMAIYMLLQLAKLPPGAAPADLLLRRPSDGQTRISPAAGS